MRVNQCMSKNVIVCAPTETIQQAAKTMREHDMGVLPVGENDRLVGMITDRDIAVRAIADGLGPNTTVREAMSKEVCYCFEDEELDDVAAQMSDLKIRRMPVLNQDKRLVGIVSLGDISKGSEECSAHALSKICERGGQHSQH